MWSLRGHTARDDVVDDPEVTITSSDPRVAHVDGTGRIHARAAGRVVLRAIPDGATSAVEASVEVIEAPGLLMKQELDGRIVAAEDFGGGPVPNDPEAEGARVLALVKSHLSDAGGLEVERVTVGTRPIPEDGFPAVGFAPSLAGLYVAVMHSGVTLAPAVGRFAAAEILDDVRVEVLEPFRPARFARA